MTEQIKVEPGPAVVLTRLPEIRTVEVLESDLDTLEDLVGRETQALGFTTALGGVAVSTLVSFATAQTLSTQAYSVYVIVSIMFSVGTLWFLIGWLRVRKARPKLLEKIKRSVRPAPTPQ